jgi:Ca2+-binding RTX toxin-like protein
MKTNKFKKTFTSIVAITALAASTSVMSDQHNVKIRTQVGADNNSIANPFVQPQDPALSGGGRDQTMQFGDVLLGTRYDDLLIGGLGTDIFAGARGNDVIIGGVEHFNPANRDRAFGGPGHDIFIWKPGDGSDLWNGGRGYDVVVFGLIGEEVDGQVVFAVNQDKLGGTVAIDPVTSLPKVDVSNSPGFCDVIDASYNLDAARELEALDLDHLVRFTIRGIANAFNSGEQNEDNGLRVTLHLKDVEVLVCTNRDGGQIEVIDLTSTPPRLIANGVSPRELKRYIPNRRLRKRLEAMIF